MGLVAKRGCCAHGSDQLRRGLPSKEARGENIRRKQHPSGLMLISFELLAKEICLIFYSHPTLEQQEAHLEMQFALQFTQRYLACSTWDTEDHFV